MTGSPGSSWTTTGIQASEEASVDTEPGKEGESDDPDPGVAEAAAEDESAGEDDADGDEGVSCPKFAEGLKPANHHATASTPNTINPP